MDFNNLYKKVEHHVTGLYQNLDDGSLVFHNLDHTQAVVNRTKEIAGHYHVNEREMFAVYAAAWFHDTGHLFTEPAKHEAMSVEIMKKYMMDHTTDTELINDIEKCILATRAPRNPADLLQQIICDADTYHLGTKEFKANNKRVYRELKLKNAGLNKTAFSSGALKMLEDHRFYTAYCKDLLTTQKEANMKKLKKKISEPEMDDEEEVIPKSNNLSELEKDKSGLVSKGIQTMLRLTSQNHLKLSDMADSKANILISVNAIIISVVLGVLARKLQEETYLKIPSLIFLSSAVATIIISILATRPKISEGTFTPEDIANKKTNLYFSGTFIGLLMMNTVLR